MTLTIDLPPEMERTLQQHAAQSGQDVGDYVLQALKEKIARVRTFDEICAQSSQETAAMSTVPTKQPPATGPTESIEAKFQRLAAAWHQAVAHHSSTTVRNNHLAYQEIIGLGPAVVPLLLRDMEAKHTHWFYALRQITGANPIPPSAAGNIRQMVEAWLRWAKENGYRW